MSAGSLLAIIATAARAAHGGLRPTAAPAAPAPRPASANSASTSVPTLGMIQLVCCLSAYLPYLQSPYLA
eukprot:CAMPEP_0180074626 /NCGR_PEP_ID=MMETSP0985-20121206/14034_1 /TAXON_ID=483367 /ORGANISM="non described non described, Strain CCMP 2436" /LENGTH=69 /DNA_ID=CAMNT_0022006445 /DNA_START=505 /DNA_END=710 /DNA_ORIENTATION=-